MKTTHWIGIVLMVLVISCRKENRWEKVELSTEKVELKFSDLSEAFFDLNNSLESLQAAYPFFFDDETSNEDWEAQRRDSLELGVFHSVQKTFPNQEYKNELETVFAYYKHYFPTEIIPEIFTYSSGLQKVDFPIIFGRNEGVMFIALDGFLGENSDWYKMERKYPYMTKTMNPQDLAPKVVQAIGREIVPFDPRQQAFIDLMIYEGKKMILADALLPKTSDELKIGYTHEEWDWAKANEGQIWNYFIEQNLIFDTDKSNRERFLDPSPYSKFLNEIETDSPGRIGVWIGWQICKKYMDENSEVSLKEFLQSPTQLIFKESKYKPKKSDGDYTPRQQMSNDEVDSSLE